MSFFLSLLYVDSIDLFIRCDENFESRNDLATPNHIRARGWSKIENILFWSGQVLISIFRNVRKSDHTF